MKEEQKLSLGEFNHICVVVKDDVEKAADFYTKAPGIGPFRFEEYSLPPVDFPDVVVRGKSSSHKMKVAFAKMGPIQLELMEIEGESIHSDFLKEKGEGVHHMGFWVADLGQELVKAE